ncbi:hypothetical protein SASPL_105835 [Salvia splendens]|uniref:Glutaredoxin domain-containing protein n=1 Tax=Salvia splendens TaxID=180675 RepID=A0A8X8YPD8_SALSN|nr:uncharacterized protein At3g28850-like [Salvia splendens]KAG6434212.1 hypothetical protein SASPL_105835 [Salvia splendens]
MKAMKGKLLKKLKTVKAIGYLKPDTILQVSGYLYTPPPNPARPPLAAIEECPNSTDLRDEETDTDDDKENVSPEENENVVESKPPSSEIDVTSFRRPDLYSRSLFDPNLLSAFEQAVMEVKEREAERRKRIEGDGDEQPPSKSRRIDPLAEFEERCPPGGGESVVLYTTGLRAIRETFEDCQKTRLLLENLRVVFLERDVSMHCEYKEEMWRILGGKIAPPRLFIKGRYIGGVEEVIGLHEQGRLKPLMQGITVDDGRRGCCQGCVGLRFIVCFNCDGSRKIMPEGDGEAIVCSECNENGLIVCPFCC